MAALDSPGGAVRGSGGRGDGVGVVIIVPLTLREAYAFGWPPDAPAVHRHHKRPQGGMFAAGIAIDGALVGCAIAGRPNARHSDGTGTLGPRELWITRVAVAEGHPNACSALYGAIRRAGVALGYTPIVTYTLPEEGGASLRGAGFRCVGETTGGGWGGVGARGSVQGRGLPALLAAMRGQVGGADDHPVGPKLRWEWP